ncbi:MAG: hypothetical protein RBG1_1C00001G1787 [candidate division Zixibacteria bacterium RBG-1]|nr:MAG: hypothetical protein RBG1_1C00001G1787 [candidate division Zixibacteria bacterium RBG-1]OGC84184.1 MAG: hypothetical protein A2V73_08930 [candidate division Zixibacteria bacterium RBG_19FT_COMBO_42_43]
MKKTILVLSWLSLACFSSGTQIQGADKIYPIKKVTPASKEKIYSQEKGIFKSFVSEKNLLELKRKTPFGLPEISAEPAQVKTIRILAIKVEFEYENPDDPTTTGRGLMDLRPYDQFVLEEGHQIDPSPHDVGYFYMHLEALRIFWETVSNGKLTLQFDVYPLDADSSYKLNHPIAYYGYFDSTRPPEIGLTLFFRESWSKADTLTPSIDFSQYDAFIIFHAGSDRQSDFPVSLTPTPNDLFSAFIVLGTAVAVDSGNFAIKEGLFLPETVSQDGIVRALNSVLAHEFGHQLGLPDLYSTKTFTTQVGDFSLMDNNGADVAVDLGFVSPVHGTLPIFADAWCKAFLGFTQPVEIVNQKNIKLIATEMLRTGIQTVKVPINSQEYFLLENRQLDLDKDGRTDLKADPTTGVILGPGKATPDSAIFTREYDALSPGSGILIWHVDEGVAYLDYDNDGVNNFLSNTLQWDKNRRFLSLVEADGIIDFGGDYYTGYGSQEDMFYFGNNSNLTPTSFPSSRSNTKANSHVYITKISRSDTVMTLDIANDFVQPGWPQRYKFSDKKSALVFADVDTVKDNIPEIFMADGKYILAWRGDSSKFISNNDQDTVIQLNGDSIFYPLAVFAQIDTPFVGPPSIGDLNSDDTLELCIGAEDGNVYVYDFSDRDLDGRADVKTGSPVKIPFGSKISLPGAIAEFDIIPGEIGFYVGYESGVAGVVDVSNDSVIIRQIISPVISGKIRGLATSDSNGIYYVLIQQDSLWSLRSTDARWSTKNFISSQVYPPVVVDLDQDTAFLNQDTTFLDVILATEEGNVYAWNQFGQLLTGFPAQLSEVISSAPVVGNIDNDNFKEIIFSGDNKIWALNYNGTLVSNFPIAVDIANPVGEILSTAVLGDLNGDKIADVIVGSPQKEILAFHSNGEKVAGFPVSVGSEVKLSCAILNLEPISGPIDSSKQIAAISEDGFVYMWQVAGNFSDTANPWPMEGLNPQHTRMIPLTVPPTPPVALQLIPPGQFYNYPNPAEKQTTIRYYLTQPATVNLNFYDLSGSLVHHGSQAGLANTDNEFVWDCSDIASGVYICRLEAFNSNIRQVGFTKIAIVK